MKLFLSFSYSLMALLSTAHRIPFKKITLSPSASLQRRTLASSPSDLQLSVDAPTNNSSFDISSVHDLIYLGNITVGNLNYSVQLDTGSSDLFIKGDTHPMPNANETTLKCNLTYNIGWASGLVAYASVDFLGIPVPSQALLDADQANNPALGYGAQGIAGLGFNRLSTIDVLVNATHQSSGRSLLYNLFAVNPSEPNFIAFALQRSTEPSDDVEGSFSIGEFEPAYSHISGNEPIPTWPIDFPYRWNLLIDAVIVNQTITVPTTQVPGAPSNKAVALIDSGSSFTYAPKAICDAIYGNIEGASFNSTTGYWQVSCAAEIDMALQIGAQVFPLHPLDINPSTLVDPTVCVGSFVAVSFKDGTDFDWLIGDNFLRSVYSVYDFGDFDSTGQMGNPYMKFLSIIDPDTASVEFHNIRGGTPRTNITYIGLDGLSVAPTFSISTDISKSLEMIGKFIPAMLAIVALNAVVLIICCIVWLITFVRKRRPRPIARTPRSRMSPMPLNIRNTYIAGSPVPDQPHTYEPVSMALTDDTFVPPSPAFYNLREGSNLRPGDRPKSVA